MELIIIRHAIAEDRFHWAKQSADDSLRPLSEQGRKRMQKQAQALSQIIAEIDLIISSPLVRAVETAEILHRKYPNAQLEHNEMLSPGGHPDNIINELALLSAAETIALVGHEPDLGELLSVLVTGQKGYLTHLKKGSACLVEFEQSLQPGLGQLRWLLPPAILRSLAGSK